MKTFFLIVTLISVITFFSGCAQVVSTNLTIDDSILMGTKTNSKDAIQYSISSQLPADHTVKMGSYKATTNANIVFNHMVNEYLQSKFVNFSSGDLVIEVELNKVDIHQEMSKSASNIIMGLSKYGGEASAICEVTCMVTVKRGGKDIGTKKIIVSSQENYNTSYGESMWKIYGDLMNKSFNKVLMIMNSFLESIDI